jgi:hypothetical protein
VVQVVSGSGRGSTFGQFGGRAGPQGGGGDSPSPPVARGIIGGLVAGFRRMVFAFVGAVARRIVQALLRRVFSGNGRR